MCVCVCVCPLCTPTVREWLAALLWCMCSDEQIAFCVLWCVFVFGGV